MTLNTRHGNGAAVVVRMREGRIHGEGRQLVSSTTEKGRCVIHHEKSNLCVEQFADP
jgi:helix-turn-helix protein